jgi:hypothetical protein
MPIGPNQGGRGAYEITPCGPANDLLKKNGRKKEEKKKRQRRKRRRKRQ